MDHHGPSLPDTFGAAFIAGMVSMGLFGMTSLQTYQYFIRYPKDGEGLKLLVSVVWAQTALHVTFMCRALYYYLITNFANPIALADGHWSLITSIALSFSIAVTVKCWFTHRLFLLSPERYRWWITSASSVLLLAHFTFGLVTVTEIGIKKHFSRLPEVEFIGALPFGVTSAASDILVSVSLCALLRTKRTDFSSSNARIQKLVVWAINRCVLNCTIVIAQLIAFIIQPSGFWPVALDFVCGQLYANSLLAVLSSRRPTRAHALDSEFGSIPMTPRRSRFSSVTAVGRVSKTEKGLPDIPESNDLPFLDIRKE